MGTEAHNRRVVLLAVHNKLDSSFLHRTYFLLVSSFGIRVDRLSDFLFDSCRVVAFLCAAFDLSLRYLVAGNTVSNS